MRHFRRRGVLGLGLTLAAGGCATSSSPASWSSLPADQQATLFGTFLIDLSQRTRLTRFQLYYRNIETNERAMLSITADLDNGDPGLYRRGEVIGNLFDLTLPPGRYEFNGFRMVAAGPLGSSEWRQRAPLSLPFQVHPASLNYVGAITAHTLVGRNIFGLPIPAGGYFVFQDQLERDLSLLKERRGQAALAPARSVVPDLEQANNPLFRRSAMPQQA